MGIRDLLGWGQPQPQPEPQPEPQQEIVTLSDEDIARLLALQQQPQDNSVVSESDPVGHIRLSLCANGMININLDWADQSNDMAEFMARVLQKLNSGELKDAFVEIIEEYGQSGEPKVRQFMKRVANIWEKLDDAPIVLPSEGLTFETNE